MERLFDLDDEGDARALAQFQSRYKDIRKEDLRVSTAVIESFTPGLRNEHSAWSWNISDTEMGEETQWIQDCKRKLLTTTVLHYSCENSDRRMLWLRAYARKARWDEELVLVPFEMECTVRSFERKAAEWEEWLPLGATEGHCAFAHRQVAMWQSLCDHAIAVFATSRATNIP